MGLKGLGGDETHEGNYGEKQDLTKTVKTTTIRTHWKHLEAAEG